MVSVTDAAIQVKDKQLVAALLPGGGYELDWQSLEPQSEQSEDAAELQQTLYSRYQEARETFLLELAWRTDDEASQLSLSLQYLRCLATMFVQGLVRSPGLEQRRGEAVVPLEEGDVVRLLEEAPYVSGSQLLDERYIEAVWERLHAAFAVSLERHGGSVAAWLRDQGATWHVAGRVYFHLVESKEGSEFPFSFLSTYAPQTQESGQQRHVPLRNALVEYGEHSDQLLELLSTVHRAAEQSELIRELLESGDLFHPIGLTSDEAYTFLKEVEHYERSGIICRIPRWWSAKGTAVKLNVSVGQRERGRLGMEAILSFEAEVWLGDQTVSADELRQLLEEEQGLRLIKGKWVEVNHQRLQEALQAYERAVKSGQSSEMSMLEAMKLHLHAERSLKLVPDDSELEVEVTNGEWLTSVLERLRRPDKLETPTSAGDDFQARLRGYQEQGVSWLQAMRSLGLGACLADDMGLGKTIQIIAFLNAVRSHGRERALLIVPASLIGNWMSELSRFAPSLTSYVCHPSENKDVSQEEALGEEVRLVITTYGMLAKYPWLLEQEWDTLILDEAQAIKNPGAKQTRLAKQVKARFRIAMTGTPIENRMADLWSLFDFLNKGLLGTAKEFTSFTRRLQQAGKGYGRLRETVGPFILRRLKTDRSIISDLPDKIEMKTYAALSKKQVLLYGKLVDELQQKLNQAEEGIQRKGLVLAALLKFKQICNHPDQYLGQQGYNEQESGKFERLRDICETIYEKRERVLIFTQFKEITAPLSAYLEGIFRHKGLVLHGETPVAKRKELVAAFQGEAYVPFMVLSIKAGGVGLNLTAANHVIHFDRWWNPAVENQATDRAFRIGQQKNVIVHKFIAKGTIEEKIDAIIEDKTRLSGEIVPDAQENWITEMDNAQLMDLMRLSL